MKLYTEEQVKFIYNSYGFNLDQNGCHEIDEDKYFEQKLKELTPIELPSNVEVGKIVLGDSPIMEHRDSGYFAAGAMKYNKWMKEQILNQNRITIKETKRSIEGIGLNKNL